MKSEKLPEKFIQLSAEIMRPLANIRGAARICASINSLGLALGARPVQVAHMRDGSLMLIDLRSKTEWYSFYSGNYEQETLHIITNLLRICGGDFLDVGANVGMYAVRVARTLNTDQRCICVEPSPSNASRIQENADLNSVQDRISIHEIALSDEDGEVDLVLREDFELGSGTGNASIAISNSADGKFRRIRVKSSRLDNLIPQSLSNNIIIAKVDIEGHEDFFLRGAMRYIDKVRPILIIEINNWYYKKRQTTSSAVFRASLPSDYCFGVIKFLPDFCILSTCQVDDLTEFQHLQTCVFYPPERESQVFAAFGER